MSRNYRLPVMNKIIITGNLTKDPELRKTISGIPVSNFRIASSRRFRDGTGQSKEEVCYVGVVAWNRLGEACYSYLHKGSSVLIEGELQSRSWEYDGLKRSVIEIRAHKIQFLDRHEQVENSYNDDSYDDGDENDNYEEEDLSSGKGNC